MTLLLEPLTAPPVVAVFGFGHVGLELARILIRHELELHLIDSRTGQFTHDRLAFLWEGTARPVLHDVPIVPERVLAELPPGAHVLVMTHDHAEDLAICDQALRTPSIGSIGLIGSATKRARFHHELQSLGHPEGLGRIRCPIGLPGITEKSPAAIAVSVAAELLPLVPSRSFNSSSAAVS